VHFSLDIGIKNKAKAALFVGNQESIDG